MNVFQLSAAPKKGRFATDNRI